MTRAKRKFVRRCAAAFGGLALSCMAGSAMAQQAAPAPQPQPAQGQVILPPSTNYIKGDCGSGYGCCPQVSGCNDCGGCGSGGGIQAGAAFYYIKPVWTANPAFITTPLQSETPTIQTDFDYSYTFSPAIWLGYASDSGLGGRVRWFRFDQNESLTRVNDGTQLILSATPLGLANGSIIAGDQLSFGSALKIETWDFEVTQSCGSCNWTGLFTGGVRYAHVRQNFSTTELPQATPAAFDSVWSGHSFNGIGPTASVEARRKVGGSLAVYANARGSLLWGDGGQTVNEVRNGNVDNVFTATTNRDQFITVGELEVGGEFSRDRGNRRLFVRAGLVAQGWFGVGNSANVGDLGDFPGTLDNGTNLGLFGLAVSAGVNY